MARVPRTSVPMTSGQGISRLGYQKMYGLGGGPPPIRSPGTLGMSSSYSKSSSTGGYTSPPSNIHVDYGTTVTPTANVASVAAQPGPVNAKPSLSLSPSGAVPFKKQMPPIRLRRG